MIDCSFFQRKIAQRTRRNCVHWVRQREWLADAQLRQLIAQSLIFLFHLVYTHFNLAHRAVNLLGGLPWRDVLRTIPVKRLYMNDEDSLDYRRRRSASVLLCLGSAARRADAL